MNRISSIIASSVLGALRAGNFAIVRNADTTFADDEREKAFASDVGANAAMAIEGADMDDEMDAEHIGAAWSPSHHARKAG